MLIMAGDVGVGVDVGWKKTMARWREVLRLELALENRLKVTKSRAIFVRHLTCI